MTGRDVETARTTLRDACHDVGAALAVVAVSLDPGGELTATAVGLQRLGRSLERLADAVDQFRRELLDDGHV